MRQYAPATGGSVGSPPPFATSAYGPTSKRRPSQATSPSPSLAGGARRTYVTSSTAPRASRHPLMCSAPTPNAAAAASRGADGLRRPATATPFAGGRSIAITARVRPRLPSTFPIEDTQREVVTAVSDDTLLISVPPPRTHATGYSDGSSAYPILLCASSDDGYDNTNINHKALAAVGSGDASTPARGGGVNSSLTSPNLLSSSSLTSPHPRDGLHTPRVNPILAATRTLALRSSTPNRALHSTAGARRSAASRPCGAADGDALTAAVAADGSFVASGAEALCPSNFVSTSSPPSVAGGGEPTVDHLFTFDAIHDGSSTQADVFDAVDIEGMLDEILGGGRGAGGMGSAAASSSSPAGNASIICCGATGSGKTHTVLGKWGKLWRDHSHRSGQQRRKGEGADDSGAADEAVGGEGSDEQQQQQYALYGPRAGLLPRTLHALLTHKKAQDERRGRDAAADAAAAERTQKGGTASQRGRAIASISLCAFELYLDIFYDLLTSRRTAVQIRDGVSTGAAQSTMLYDLTARLGVASPLPSSSSDTDAPNGDNGYDDDTAPLFYGDTSAAGASILAASSQSTAKFLLSISQSGLPSAKVMGGPKRALVVPIDSLDDIAAAFVTVQRNRTTCATNRSDQSSRSHGVYLVRVDYDHSNDGVTRTGKRKEEEEHTQCSIIAFVDLAGSERLHAVDLSLVGQQEAQYINKSLSSFYSVLKALGRGGSVSDGDAGAPPYRNSRLTRLLRPCLEASHVRMVVHLHPGDGPADETMATLRLAEDIRKVSLPSTTTGSSRGKASLLPTAAALNADSSGVTLRSGAAGADCTATRSAVGLLAEFKEASAMHEALCAEVRMANTALGYIPRRLGHLVRRKFLTTIKTVQEQQAASTREPSSSPTASSYVGGRRITTVGLQGSIATAGSLAGAAHHQHRSPSALASSSPSAAAVQRGPTGSSKKKVAVGNKQQPLDYILGLATRARNANVSTADWVLMSPHRSTSASHAAQHLRDPAMAQHQQEQQHRVMMDGGSSLGSSSAMLLGNPHDVTAQPSLNATVSSLPPQTAPDGLTNYGFASPHRFRRTGAQQQGTARGESDDVSFTSPNPRASSVVAVGGSSAASPSEFAVSSAIPYTIPCSQFLWKMAEEADMRALHHSLVVKALVDALHPLQRQISLAESAVAEVTMTYNALHHEDGLMTRRIVAEADAAMAGDLSGIKQMRRREMLALDLIAALQQRIRQLKRTDEQLEGLDEQLRCDVEGVFGEQGKALAAEVKALKRQCDVLGARAQTATEVTPIALATLKAASQWIEVFRGTARLHSTRKKMRSVRTTVREDRCRMDAVWYNKNVVGLGKLPFAVPSFNELIIPLYTFGHGEEEDSEEEHLVLRKRRGGRVGGLYVPEAPLAAVGACAALSPEGSGVPRKMPPKKIGSFFGAAVAGAPSNARRPPPPPSGAGSVVSGSRSVSGAPATRTASVAGGDGGETPLILASSAGGLSAVDTLPEAFARQSNVTSVKLSYDEGETPPLGPSPPAAATAGGGSGGAAAPLSLPPSATPTRAAVAAQPESGGDEEALLQSPHSPIHNLTTTPYRNGGGNGGSAFEVDGDSGERGRAVAPPKSSPLPTADTPRRRTGTPPPTKRPPPKRPPPKQ